VRKGERWLQDEIATKLKLERKPVMTGKMVNIR